MVWAEIGWHEVFAVDRDKMGGSVDSINMYYTVCALVLLIELRAHQPHTSIFVWMIANAIKPVYNRAWVIGALVMKREPGEDARDLEAVHRIGFWVCIHECTVIPWSFIPPVPRLANNLAPHAVDTADVAGCIEERTGGTEHPNFAGILRVVGLQSIELFR